MTDLEGITNNLLDLNREENDIIEYLKNMYKIFKTEVDDETLMKLSKSVLEEVTKSRVQPTDETIKDLLKLDHVGLSIGDQGVGCRGLGDFFVHKLITQLAKTNKSIYLSPDSLDDAGAVIIQNIDDPEGKTFIVSKMEGMHSRLSNWPFIAGFHVTRACLRDLLVKGSIPISIMVDIHLGDDCDVAKLFDFMAGVACVAELSNVPITAGSTLRIGGDMVIGTRITGGIAAVGVCDRVLARKDIKRDCDILMSEGAGGGTIATTALYNAKPDKIIHTLNIKFLQGMQLLLSEKELLESVYCCCDVTNGGLRGDLFEILNETGLGVEIFEKDIIELVNAEVKELLDSTSTDYLGVSLDALLIFCKPEASEKILQLLNSNGIKTNKIGYCKDEKGMIFHSADGKTRHLTPKFRESAYTPVKKIIGEKRDKETQDKMNKLVQVAYENSIKKKERILNWIKESVK